MTCSHFLSSALCKERITAGATVWACGTSYYQYSLLKVIYLLDSPGSLIKLHLPYSYYSCSELDFHSDEKGRPKKSRLPNLKETINYMHIFIVPICSTHAWTESAAMRTRGGAQGVEWEWWWDAAKATHLPPLCPTSVSIVPGDVSASNQRTEVVVGGPTRAQESTNKDIWSGQMPPFWRAIVGFNGPCY